MLFFVIHALLFVIIYYVSFIVYHLFIMCDLLCTQRVNMKRPQGVKQYKLYTSSSDSDSGNDVVGDDDNDEVKRSMK